MAKLTGFGPSNEDSTDASVIEEVRTTLIYIFVINIIIDYLMCMTGVTLNVWKGAAYERAMVI